MQHFPGSKITLFKFSENHCSAKIYGDTFSEIQPFLVKALLVRHSRDLRHFLDVMSGWEWGEEKVRRVG